MLATYQSITINSHFKYMKKLYCVVIVFYVRMKLEKPYLGGYENHMAVNNST